MDKLESIRQRMEEDAAFAASLKGMKTPEEVKTRLCEAGYDLTEDEFKKIVCVKSTEIPEEDLDKIVGGGPFIMLLSPEKRF